MREAHASVETQDVASLLLLTEKRRLCTMHGAQARLADHVHLGLAGTNGPDRRRRSTS